MGCGIGEVLGSSGRTYGSVPARGLAPALFPFPFLEGGVGAGESGLVGSTAAGAGAGGGSVKSRCNGVVFGESVPAPGSRTRSDDRDSTLR